MFRVEADGRLHGEWLTESLTRVFGLSLAGSEPPEVWARLVHPDDLPRAQAHGQRLLAGQEDRCELRLFTPSG